MRRRMTRTAAARVMRATLAIAALASAAIALAGCGSTAAAPAASATSTRTFTDATDHVSFVYTAPVLSAYGAADVQKSAAWATAQGIASSGAKVVALASDRHQPVHAWLLIATKPSIQVKSQTAGQVAGKLLPGLAKGIGRQFAKGMGVPVSTVTATTGLFHGAPSILLTFHQFPQALTAKAFGVRLTYTRSRAFLLLWLVDKAASPAEQRAIAAAAASVTTTW
jgi:hypothetical protein